MSEDVCVKISGLNLSRLIDGCVREGLLIKNLVVKSKYIKFEISTSNINQLNKICKTENKRYEILYKSGIKNLIHKLPYCFGFLLAILIVTAYIVSFNLFVFNINLSYVSGFDYEISKVEKYLHEKGYSSGMSRKDINAMQLQKDILKDFDDISGCTVRLVGGNLNIMVYPGIKKEENQPQKLYSKYDAIVTKAEAFSGDLHVKTNDVVKAGDLLISSDTVAQGEVIGKVYFTSSLIYNSHQQYLERTGNSYTYNNLIFCKKFRVYGKNMSKFVNYDVSICRFYFNANLFIPIEVEQITVYEAVVKERVVPFETKEKEIMDNAYHDALAKVPDTSKITNVTYSVVQEENYTRVDCFIETEISLI